MDPISGVASTAISVIPRFLQKPAISLDLNGWVPKDKSQKPISEWDLWIAISSKNPTSAIIHVDTEFEYKLYNERWEFFNDWDIKNRYLLPGQGFYFPKKMSGERIDKGNLHKLYQNAIEMKDEEYAKVRTDLLIFRVGATAKFDSKCLPRKFVIPKMRYFFDFRRLVLIPWFRKDDQFSD